MNGMTIGEKIIAHHCGKSFVAPGEFVMVDLDFVVGNFDPQHGLEENEFGDIFDPDPVKRRDPFSCQSAAPDDAAIIFGVLEKDVQRDLERAAVLASKNFRDIVQLCHFVPPISR